MKSDDFLRLTEINNPPNTSDEPEWRISFRLHSTREALATGSNEFSFTA